MNDFIRFLAYFDKAIVYRDTSQLFSFMKVRLGVGERGGGCKHLIQQE